MDLIRREIPLMPSDDARHRRTNAGPRRINARHRRMVPVFWMAGSLDGRADGHLRIIAPTAGLQVIVIAHPVLPHLLHF
jgi:hypothetical protein